MTKSYDTTDLVDNDLSYDMLQFKQMQFTKVALYPTTKLDTLITTTNFSY